MMNFKKIPFNFQSVAKNGSINQSGSGILTGFFRLSALLIQNWNFSGIDILPMSFADLNKEFFLPSKMKPLFFGLKLPLAFF